MNIDTNNIQRLNYQVSEFDCGPACILNALTLTFGRSKISSNLIKAVYNLTLDDDNGGTSCVAMRKLSDIINNEAYKKHLLYLP